MCVEDDEVFEDGVLVPEREVRPGLHEDDGEVREDREGQLEFAAGPELRGVDGPGTGVTVHECAVSSRGSGFCLHRRLSFHEPIIQINLKIAQCGINARFGDVPYVSVDSGLLCRRKRSTIKQILKRGPRDRGR